MVTPVFTSSQSGRQAFSVQGVLLFNELPEKLRKEISLIKSKNLPTVYNFNSH